MEDLEEDIALFRNAIQRKDVEEVRARIAAGADIEEKKFWRSPLILAIYYRAYDVIDVLLEAGVDVNRQNEEVNALMYAASRNEPIVVEKLLAAGADIEAVNFRGATALGYAIMLMSYPCVDILLAAGANPLTENNSGYSCLWDAMRHTADGFYRKADTLLATVYLPPE